MFVKNRLIAMLVALFLIVPAWAMAETVTVDGIVYEIDESTKEAIVGKNPEAAGHISIPSTIKHEDAVYDVVGVGETAFYQSVIESVDLASGIEYLGYLSFGYCPNLQSISLPNTLEEIAPYTFQFCEKLDNIEFPASLKRIGETAFSNCNGLTSVEIPATIEHIGKSTFTYCKGLKNVTLQSGLKSISEHMFLNCQSLKNITSPESVVEIGFGAFDMCNGIKVTCKRLQAPEFYTSVPLESDLFEDDAIIYAPARSKGYTKENGWPNVVFYEDEVNKPLGDVLGDTNDVGSAEIKRPTLILSKNGQDILQFGFLSFEVKSKKGNSITYDISLHDIDGKEIILADDCLLVFPFPEGIHSGNHKKWKVTITHHATDGTKCYSSEDGGIEFLPFGMGIKVSSFSPFIIEWEEIPDEVNVPDLPKTGDNSAIGIWLALLVIAGCGILLANKKRIA